jgi:hypothetical protein
MFSVEEEYKMWLCVVGCEVNDVSKDRSDFYFQDTVVQRRPHPEDEGTTIIQNVRN